MPAEPEPVPITRVFGVPREGMKRHVFVAGNFFMQRMLNRYRDDLEVAALPQELAAAADYTVSYLKEKAARVSLENVQMAIHGPLASGCVVENLGGHKLPTAYPVPPLLAACLGARPATTEMRLRIRCATAGRLDRGQRQRCRSAPLRAALHRDHQQRSGADL